MLLPLLSGVAGATPAIPHAPSPGITLTALAALIVVALGARPWLRAATRLRPAAAEGAGGTPERDFGIDFLRGLAIVFVVVDHIGVSSLYYLVSAERVGVMTGAELFVVLSGTVLGLTFRRRGREDTWRREAGRVLARARTLYLTALLVTLGAYVVSQLPGVNPGELTTYTEDGTVSPTYTGTDRPLAFLADVLLLKSGPWPFNIMGLYVVLLALTPPLLLLLLRGRVLWLLAGSWLLYLLHALAPVPLLPTQFSASFPLLAWQLLFVHGLALGYYRQEVRAWLRTPPGRTLLVVAALTCVLLAFYSWNNPRVSPHPSLIPAQTFRDVYAHSFSRSGLGIGRLVNVAALVIVATAVLDRFRPLFARTLGWLLVPLGQATLYVYVLQVGFVLLVSSVPVLRGGGLRRGTLVHTLILLLIWGMVRRRVLFRWIPR